MQRAAAVAFMLALVMVLGTVAVEAASTFREAYVDGNGVMRWKDDDSEIALFGVNYLLPFGDEYHRTSLLGEDPWVTLERDFSHLKRLGVELIRLHVFDREISDKDGNLVESIHLQLLDRLVELSQQHGMYLFLTPIAWWWTPNPSPGFSTYYPMMEMNVDSAAIRAQEVYLEAFLSRVNPRTGRRYADEPNVIAWEIINEPLYYPSTSDEQVLAYIERLAASIRKTGTTKPVFYNFWEGKAHLARASGLDGATFNWYPTGLNAEAGRRENVLPLVERVPWPAYESAYRGMAKAVYEFDAADILSPLYLPAMARTMRCAGVQMAAQFQYDALSTAPFNAAYATHYLNLAYTPDKAVGLWIAGHVFRSMTGSNMCGPVFENSSALTLDPDRDVAILEDGEWFAYTGSTDVAPRDRKDLRHVYGVGSSPVVAYEGTGAYFLDQVKPGLWSLDLFPDVVPLADPHAPSKLGREVGRLISRAQRMAVDLPGMEHGFRVIDAESGVVVAHAEAGVAFEVEPGSYWLAAVSEPVTEPEAIVDRPYIPMPDQGSKPPAIRHQAPSEAVAGEPVALEVTVAADEPPKRVLAVLKNSGADGTEGANEASLAQEVLLQPAGAYLYRGQVPGDWVKEGVLRYSIRVDVDGTSYHFPAGAEDDRPEGQDLLLDLNLSLASRFAGMQSPGTKGALKRYIDDPADRSYLHVSAEEFEYPDGHVNVTLPAAPVPEAGVLVLEMRSSLPQTSRVQIVLIDRLGRGFGKNVSLSPRWQEIRIPLEDLYPVWDGLPGSLDPGRLSQIALIFGSWLYGFNGSAMPHGFVVSRIAFERAPAHFEVPVRPGTGETEASIDLFAPQLDHVAIHGVPSRKGTVLQDADGWVLRMEADGFGEPPHWIYFYHPVRSGGALGGHGGQDDTGAEYVFEIEVRSLSENLKWAEIVFIERDGAPWGVNIPVSTEWSVVRLLPEDLHYFSHWGNLPVGRGTPGDGLRVEELQAVNFGFGAWLVPGHESERHGVEIRRITLRRK